MCCLCSFDERRENSGIEDVPELLRHPLWPRRVGADVLQLQRPVRRQERRQTPLHRRRTGPAGRPGPGELVVKYLVVYLGLSQSEGW